MLPLIGAVLAATATASAPWPLPPPTAMAPRVVPQLPAPDWSWDVLPTSMHGADRDRAYNASEIERLAKYNMVTLEKCEPDPLPSPSCHAPTDWLALPPLTGWLQGTRRAGARVRSRPGRSAPLRTRRSVSTPS
jgi:hypothetical protein